MKGIGYGEDIKAVDVFEHIKIFKVFRFDTVRHAGVGDHYSSATGKSLKLFSRRKNLFTNSDVARENNVSVSSSRECIR